MVDQFLCLLLIEYACFKVALNVDIEERCRAPQRHRAAILRFHCRQVSEVEPLHRFLCILRRTGDVKTVFRRHFLNLQQRTTMFRQLLTQTERSFEIFAFFQTGLEIGKLQFAFTYQITDAVKRHAAVVTDDTPTTITIW